MRKFYFNFQMFDDTKITPALTKKAWSKQLWKEAQIDNFFGRFTAEGPNAIIEKKTDLKKEKGDKITTGLMMKLTGDGVTGDNMLEGNEEKIIFLDFAVEVDQIRNAVRLAGSMQEQKAAYNLRSAAKESLKVWLAEKIEKDIFKALTADPTANRLLYAGGRKAENQITAGDKFSAEMISAARRKAMLATPKIRPVNVNGKNYYVMIIDSYQARDLKNDEKWLSAQKDANQRGLDNPIFTGALGLYDGVVVHEHENVIRTATGATSGSGDTATTVEVGHALLLGAQAAVLAIAQEPTWKEKSFDYEDKAGFATGMIRGVEKAKFTDPDGNTFDFAAVQVITSSVAD